VKLTVINPPYSEHRLFNHFKFFIIINSRNFLILYIKFLTENGELLFMKEQLR